MRSHLGCSGFVLLGPISAETQKRLDRIAATWLEYAPESSSLVVRHVQPDDAPALREVAGELLDFLHALSEPERAWVDGGELYYQDDATGQYVRLKVAKGGFLTVAWARADYNRAQWEVFRSQPVRMVFAPFQRLNGTVHFEGPPHAADNLHKIIDTTAGQYSQGDYTVTSSLLGVELTLRDTNADGLILVNALRHLATPGSLSGDIDISSFRAGDLEDYLRFSFRQGETWMARPVLWSDTPGSPATPADPVPRAA